MFGLQVFPQDQMVKLLNYLEKCEKNKIGLIGVENNYGKMILELVKKNLKKITLTEYILLDESLISDTKYLNEIAKKFLNYEKTDDLNDKINSKYDSMFVIGNTNFVLELMPILTYYDLDLTYTDILGTSILNDKLLINEHSLINAKFPIVRQNKQNEFMKKWQSLWPSRPNELSRLGYDLSKISMWVVNQNDHLLL